MIQYILESAFCLACLYVFYWLALRRETFFQWNRVYLLVSPLLALGLPALNIQLESPQKETILAVEAVDLPVLVEQAQVAPQAVRHTLAQPVAQGWSWSLAEVLWWIYLIGAGLLTLRLVIRMWYLWQMIRRCRRVRAGNPEVAVSNIEPLPLASFFGFIFWNPGTSSADNQKLLLEHEMVHVRQWHSLDVLLMEAMVIVYWFNPLMHAFRRSLCAVHEYIADDHVVRQTRKRYEYASLLVQHQVARSKKQPQLVNTFHSLIKNRLAMLARRPSRSFHRFKYALALPLFAAMMLLFSFRLIEKLPAAAPILEAMQTVEKYASTLNETVVLTKNAEVFEPTPYNFYWGSIQCKIYHETVSDTYFGEADISPEEFREALKREPRIWNGQTLEQHVAFTLGNLVIRSDYNDESVYATRRRELENFAAILQKDDHLQLGKVSLPNAKTATIRLSLGAEVAAWIKSAKGGSIDWQENPDVLYALLFGAYPILTWGEPMGAHYDPDKQFYTVGEFWEILQSDPVVTLPEGASTQTNEDTMPARLPNSQLLLNQMKFMVMKPGSGLIVPMNEENATIGQVRASFAANREQIQPEVVILFYWAKPDAAGARWYNSAQMASFTLVPDGDPRLTLRRSEQKDYRFEWGDFTGPFLKQYALRFRAAGGKNIAADRPVQVENHSLTTKKIIQMLRLQPRFYQNNQAIELQNFTLDYNGYGVVVDKEGVPEDVIRMLEKNLKPGEKIRLTGFQARAGGFRNIVGALQYIRQMESDIDVNALMALDIGASNGNLTRLTVSEHAYGELRHKYSDQTGVFFQYGEVDLTHATVILEARSEDPKPSLREMKEALLQEITLSVTPNPATDKISLSFDLPQAGRGRLSIANAMGQEVYALETDFQAGQGSYPVFTRDLKSTGVFYVTLEMTYGKATQQFLVQQ